MEYGCIGEHLGHSFSKEIHNLIAPYEYELREVSREDVGPFMTAKEFRAINVTIPYKEAVIPYLYEIDESAKAIGAVNTVVNRDGKLFGYNTDFYGMSSLIKHLGIDFLGAKVALLGTGGTSKTAYAVAKHLGAADIRKVSRGGKDGALTYEGLYSDFSDADIIINTTPSGMFPDTDGIPIDLDLMPRVKSVIDAVYNPLRTRLVTEAKKRGIIAGSGLYMLVAQGVRASEIFMGEKYECGTCDTIYKEILASKENIVLTGMPGSGKTTVGKRLSVLTGKELVDIDELIVKKAGKSITEIFKCDGEKTFRDLESEIIKEVSKRSGIIVATGGGAVLRPENIDALKQNGRIVFLDRPLSDLVPTDDRPLAKNRTDIEKRFSERYEIYLSSADIRIDACGDSEDIAQKIRKALTEA